jgi:HK97 family phage prohead protease
MNSYVAMKRDYFNRYKKLISEEIQKTSSPGKLAELRQGLCDAESEERQFEESLKHSTLRRRLLDNASKNSYKKIETRMIATDAVSDFVRVQERASGSKYFIRGYAALFNSPSLDLGGWVEEIAPGAFTNVLKKSDPRLLFNHDPNYLLARRSAGTLKLKEDSRGLFYVGALIPGDSVSYNIRKRIARRDIQGNSFHFIAEKDEWIFERGKPDKRILIEVGELFDVGPVTYPAYPDTTVSVYEERNFDFIENQRRLYEEELQEERWLEKEKKDRQRQIRHKYRLAERIINRNKI